MKYIKVFGKTFFLLLFLLVLSSTVHSRMDDQPPPSDLGQTWVETNGQIYGAKPDERGPIGGGKGYKNILTTGNYIVSTVDELREALKKAKSGEIVYVEEDAEIDCTSLVFAERMVLEIPEGVTLASNRGYNASKGALIYSDAFATKRLFKTLGPNVRITGLRIRGPDPKNRIPHHRRAHSDPMRKDKRKAQRKYYYSFPTSEGISSEFSGLEIDNCELSGWAHAAIYLLKSKGNHVHHCYIHHNQRMGLGYGVSHNQAESLIEYNLFNYNRHSIAGTGRPWDCYEARHNVEIEHSLSHNFDMHGGSDKKDGTNIAGKWIIIHHNTFRGKTIRAINIRGIPREKAVVHNNWFFHQKPGKSVMLPWPISNKNHIEFNNNPVGTKKHRVLEVK